MKIISVHLTDAQASELERLSRQQALSVASLVRMTLVKVLNLPIKEEQDD